jgi:hypothetical protein
MVGLNQRFNEPHLTIHEQLADPVSLVRIDAP